MTILPSDDAFGVISFAPDSLSRTVSEASGSTVYLTVQRTGGVLGSSTVYWQVSGQGSEDVENINGSVVLAVFSNNTQIAIRIKEDSVCCFSCCCCSFRFLLVTFDVFSTLGFVYFHRVLFLVCCSFSCYRCRVAGSVVLAFFLLLLFCCFPSCFRSCRCCNSSCSWFSSSLLMMVLILVCLWLFSSCGCCLSFLYFLSSVLAFVLVVVIQIFLLCLICSFSSDFNLV